MKKIAVLFFTIVLFCLMGITQVEAKDYEVKTMKDFQNSVKLNVDGFQSKFKITYKGDIKDFKNKIGKIVDDITTQNPVLSPYLGYAEYSYTIKNNVATVNYKINYVTTKKEYDYASTQAKSIAKTIASQNKTEFDKVKAVNDYITKNTEYAFTNDNKEYTPYGLFKNKKAVCEGYALAAYQILKELGIGVQYVSGTAGGEAHGWNKVKVDGKWYNLDITWNDPLPNQPNQTMYKYFLITDTSLEKDHKWDKKIYQASTDTKYDFFKNADYATKINNDVYYQNKVDGDKLYKYTINTKKNEKLSNARPIFIQSYNNKLYYSDYANGGYLTQSDLNGKNTKVLAKVHAKNIYIKGNILYYQVNGVYKTIKI